MKRIGMFAATFCLALAITPTTCWSVDAQAAGLAFEEIAPPPEEAHAIALSGKSENPTPETWLRKRENEAPTWWIGPPYRILARNVSQATLTPFLPDSAKATGAAVILAPGGGTLVLGMEVQGYQIAKWLNERGIAAFVLKYRLVPTPKDLSAFLRLMERHAPVKYSDVVPEKAQQEEAVATHEDALEAVRYLRAHASQLKISPDRIGFMGFSAGGFTAAGVALQADEASRPNIVALIYGTMPGELTVGTQAPPIFIAATSDDPLYSIGGSVDPYLSTYRAWQHAHVPAELHMFATGGHGFGIASQGNSSDQWLTLLDNWLRARGFETLSVGSSGGAEIRSVLAHPVFNVGFACSEHGAESSTWDLGDAFGTDCFVEKRVEVDGHAWARPYKASGNQNQDWYGWQREVLSPCSCKVLEINVNPEPNRPGVMGTKPASLFKLKRDDGVIFHVAHFDKPLVKIGESVVEGQVIARVGNNGLSHHPHIHIGAYQGSEPLQIRFDQRFIQPMEATDGK